MSKADVNIPQNRESRSPGSAKTLRRSPQPVLPHPANEDASDYIILDWDEWATKIVPPREKLMVPIIPEKGLIEIYAPRGVGKTFLSLGIAIAVATGTNFLRWTVPRPRRVLYVDGEMPFIDLQERAKWMVASLDASPQQGFLRLYAADLQSHGIPDLASEQPEGRNNVEKALRMGEPDQVELLILDNLSTLTNTGSENSDEAWAYMQEWLLKLRRHGVSVLFVHHAGKTGKQRGTSKREDALDTVIKLSSPNGYQASEGARFEISYEKQRGFFGKDAEPFEARFSVKDGVGSWEMRPVGERALIEKVAELKGRGNSYREIEAKTGISKSRAARLSDKAVNLGLLMDTADAGTIIQDSTPSH